MELKWALQSLITLITNKSIILISENYATPQLLFWKRETDDNQGVWEGVGMPPEQSQEPGGEFKDLGHLEVLNGAGEVDILTEWNLGIRLRIV